MTVFSTKSAISKKETTSSLIKFFELLIQIDQRNKEKEHEQKKED